MCLMCAHTYIILRHLIISQDVSKLMAKLYLKNSRSYSTLFIVKIMPISQKWHPRSTLFKLPSLKNKIWYIFICKGLFKYYVTLKISKTPPPSRSKFYRHAFWSYPWPLCTFHDIWSQNGFDRGIFSNFSPAARSLWFKKITIFQHTHDHHTCCKCYILNLQ